MKKIFIISIFYFFLTNILIANEHKCSGMKKLSKEYLACTAKNIKEGAVKKKDQIKEESVKKTNQIKEGASKKKDQVKEGSIKKTNQIKEGTKKIFDKIKTKIKKN